MRRWGRARRCRAERERERCRQQRQTLVRRSTCCASSTPKVEVAACRRSRCGSNKAAPSGQRRAATWRRRRRRRRRCAAAAARTQQRRATHHRCQLGRELGRLALCPDQHRPRPAVPGGQAAGVHQWRQRWRRGRSAESRRGRDWAPGRATLGADFEVLVHVHDLGLPAAGAALGAGRREALVCAVGQGGRLELETQPPHLGHRVGEHGRHRRGMFHTSRKPITVEVPIS